MLFTSLGLSAQTARDYYDKGLDALNDSDPWSALGSFNKAIALNPRCTDACFQRGLANYYAGAFNAAIADFTTTLQLDPAHTDAYYERGAVKLESKDLDGALTDLNKAIELNPRYEKPGSTGLAPNSPNSIIPGRFKTAASD